MNQKMKTLGNVVEVPQLTSSALKKCLQMVDDLVPFLRSSISWIDPKFKHNMEAVMTPYKEV